MFSHIPVLLNEVIEGLDIKEDGIYVDATLGGGGHSEKILEKLDKGRGFLIGIDQDIDAISVATERLKKYIDKKKLIVVKNNFENIDLVLDDLKIDKISGILFDLGVSSYQFDEGKRGFSYNKDAHLDMRMDKDIPLTCEKLVNEFSENDLYHIIKDYGEDIFAKNIAKKIVEYRQNKKIETTLELVDIIKTAIPAKLRFISGVGKNPAKRTFQAFRIYINREMEVISIALDKIIDRLTVGGRICVISFHSLEDRIVKQFCKSESSKCRCNNIICTCEPPKIELVNKKPIMAGELEIRENPPSRSAKLRVAKCIR